MSRLLRVFLCHATQDKPAVRELYNALKSEGWIDPWLDKAKILPGQDWEMVIEKAVDASDVVVICLSNQSVTKEGFVQREIRYAYDLALEKPEDTIFLIPLRLDDCPVPRKLKTFHWVDYFGAQKQGAYADLLEALQLRHGQKLKLEEQGEKRERAEREAKQEAEELTLKLAAEKTLRERSEREAEELVRRLAAEKTAHEKEEREATAKRTMQEHIPLNEPKREKTVAKPEQEKTAGKPFPFAIGGLGLFLAVGLFIAGIVVVGNWLSDVFKLGQEPVVTEASVVFVTPIATMVSEKDGMTMVYVPAGEFMMGSEYGEDDEKPVHKVYLDAFWIDQTEVTNVMFAKFIDNTDYITTAQKKGDSYLFQGKWWTGVSEVDWMHPTGPNSSISGKENHPVIHVSWNDAAEYCKWAGRRLATEAEWEKAASWNEFNKDKYVYPWGNGFDGSLVNSCDANCIFDWSDKNFNDGYSDTSPVKNYPNGVSPYGAYDMAGNVWEWVADWYNKTYYQNSLSDNPLGAETGTLRVMRGGSWFNLNNLIRSTDRIGSPLSYSSQDIGFRCARSE